MRGFPFLTTPSSWWSESLPPNLCQEREFCIHGEVTGGIKNLSHNEILLRAAEWRGSTQMLKMMANHHGASWRSFRSPLRQRLTESCRVTWEGPKIEYYHWLTGLTRLGLQTPHSSLSSSQALTPLYPLNSSLFHTLHCQGNHVGLLCMPTRHMNTLVDLRMSLIKQKHSNLFSYFQLVLSSFFPQWKIHFPVSSRKKKRNFKINPISVNIW